MVNRSLAPSLCATYRHTYLHHCYLWNEQNSFFGCEVERPGGRRRVWGVEGVRREGVGRACVEGVGRELRQRVAVGGGKYGADG